MSSPSGDRLLSPATAPQTLEDTGLRLEMVLQLLVKSLHFAGDLTGVELADRLGFTFPVIEPAVDQMKVQRLCEIVGGAALGAPSYRYRITDFGRDRAAAYLDRNMYTGTAPVPLEQYRRYMTDFQASAPRSISQQQVREAFSHLVLSDRVLDQLGPGINAAHSIFVYGPPGNGKTVLSQAIAGLLPGDFWIPYALDVEGSLVRVFDPVNHEPDRQQTPDAGLESVRRHDRRWIRCRRPSVTVGGELTLEQLELTYNPTSGFYRAPVQLLANGGVLIIDDFGRQRVAPHALLNRWITPLESRVDYLTLHSGQKFEIPFMVLPVFATNIKPAELVDEAFLRRIRYKVFAGNPTAQDFEQIFENVCRDRGIPFDPTHVAFLLDTIYTPACIGLRGCQPRDLIDHALSLAQYREEPRELTTELLEAACATYFVDEAQGVSRAG
jgi:predicted ATPase with chaperone activity